MPKAVCSNPCDSRLHDDHPRFVCNLTPSPDVEKCTIVVVGQAIKIAVAKANLEEMFKPHGPA